MKIKAWLKGRERELADRWLQEIRTGRDPGDTGGLDILETVVKDLVSILPYCFGERREVALETWQHATHLYGSLALLRGLAAGEVVDELQLLRGVILRLFLTETGKEEGDPGQQIFPMEFLTLNRVLDMGVSRASIAYVDDLFFTHLQGSGVPRGLDEETRSEIGRQLEGFREELTELEH